MERERNNLWSWRLRFDHHNVDNFAVNAIKNVTNLELSFFFFFLQAKRCSYMQRCVICCHKHTNHMFNRLTQSIYVLVKNE
jgi:hypothetical protein